MLLRLSLLLLAFLSNVSCWIGQVITGDALRPEVVHTGDHNNRIGDQLRQELSELLNHEEVDAILTTSKKKLGDDDREVAPAKSIHVQLDDLENSEIGAAAHETVYRRYIKLFLGSIKILTKAFKKTKN
ncbi:hypothetical protein IWW34DRAFT_838290 [Fusarium oxysporum f. sp. albedinis]|nr:hypothetical protein IWW34DRAFT_838290 [Fusarium oxysporum f. sp. albedinis]